MNKKGFTIVEVMVAILVFAVGLVGAFVLVNTAISLSVRSKQEIIATNLIREQLELAKNVRDTNWLALRDWKSLSWTVTSGASCASSCLFEAGAWYRLENRFWDAPVFVEKVNTPVLSEGDWARKSAILWIANQTNNPLRRCLDDKGRYVSCASGGKPTPYYTYLQVAEVKSKDASNNAFVVPGILQLTAYMATTEGWYREYSFSTLISDWKK